MEVTNKKGEWKKCNICKALLTTDNCNPNNIKSYSYICKDCERKRGLDYYYSNQDIEKEKRRAYDLNIKLEIIKQYGGQCTCCKENRYQFLTIDHIDDNGVEERKNTKQGSGGKLYRWLRKMGYPKDNYQLLCFNCNCAKGFWGYCPHQKE